MTYTEQKLASSYWLKKVRNASVLNDFPLINQRTAKEVLVKEELLYFSKLTSSNAIIEYTVLLSVFNALIYRYFGAENFVYSSKIGKDNIPLLFKSISIKGKTVKQYLQKVKKEVHEVYQHSKYDLKIQKKYPFEKYATYSFLYNARTIKPNSLIPFIFSIKRIEKDLEIEVLYSDSFVDDVVVNHFLKTFKTWVSNLENYIEEHIEKISIVTQTEKQQLLETFNNTTVDYPKDKTLIDLFEEQVIKAPDNIAVVFEDRKLTYKELNERVNQLADYLRQNYGIKPDDLIAIKLERSEWMIISILGILKSGGAYVPINPNYPEKRIDYIQENTQCKVVIDEGEIQRFLRTSLSYSVKNADKINTPTDLAYVIYTSGTTGQPKGVMIEHTSLVNRLVWMQKNYSLDKFDTLIQKTTYSFDVSVWELIWWSFYGAKLSIPISGVEKDPSLLLENIKENKVTVIHFVPSMLSVFLDYLKDNPSKRKSLTSLKQVFVSGEALTLSQRVMFYKCLPAVSLTNLYGPTEASIDVTCYDCSENIETSSIPIGKPIDNTQIYILTENFQLAPIGVPGKLFISGVGLSRGYLNRPELTAEKFIENPFEKRHRMYDTGDMAKWLPDGNIEFLGRKDHQVKLRGYRIELGEIENTVLSYSENINQAVVLVNNETLVTYYTEKNVIDKEALKGHLKEKLPSYMVPNHFEVLESIPLTTNGKVDRKSLGALNIGHRTQSNYVGPRNEIEEKLVGIWQDVLGVERVGIQDDFFELGGHSLMIGQAINQIYKQLNGRIAYKEFFQDPVIESIAKVIKKERYVSISKAEDHEYYPLTPSQYRIWVLSQLEGGSQAYNMPGTVIFTGSLEIDKLKRAFALLIDRHEILRTCFKTNEEGEVHQYVVDNNELDFDIRFDTFKGKSKEEIDQHLHQEQIKPFDLTKAPLLRGFLLCTGEEEYLFSFVMHHIVGDGWSMKLLISEIIANYNELLKNNKYKTEGLSIQYKDYSIWLRSQLNKEAYKTSEAYWLDKFQGELPVLDLPSFKKRPVIQTYNGKTVSHQFSEEFLCKLKRFSKENDATLFMVLMTGINTLLYRYTNQNDIIIGTPIAGREHPDLENQIGLFLNTLPIRIQLEEGDISFDELLQRQKLTLLEAYEHQNYPFDELVSRLDLKRDTSRSALFDVMVVLQNQNQIRSLSSNNNTFEGVQIIPYELERNTSQMDMSITFVEEGKELHLEIEYNTDIYDELLTTRIFNHFENLLNQAIDTPEKSLLTIDYLTKEESKQLLEEFNNTKTDFPRDKTIVDLFEEQVRKAPNNAAVIFEGKKLTYGNLNEKANQLAEYLRKNYNIQPDNLAAIKLDRSENLIVAILGILKSGGAYVPIDTNYPQQRIEYIEQDSKAKVVIDKGLLEEFEKQSLSYGIENLKPIITPDNLAYVIYTSGTTGKPKGVMVEHKNVVSIYSDWKKQYELNTFKINLLQLASVSFDVFVGDICRSLLNGGTMIIPSNDVKLNPEALYALMEEHHISIFEGTPGLLLPLLDYIKENNKDYSFLKRIIFGSDSFNNSTFNAIKDHFESSDLKIINSYGVTEATIDSTFYDEYSNKIQGTTPIGKPFSNTEIYILNTVKNVTPIGVFGELFIGGAGVSRGYYGRTELTQFKFINIDQSKEKVYATGDVARWLPDGNIEFLGRNDDQVKIRGYRIELGEVENALNEFSENIKQTVVSVKETNNGKVLIAYYVSSIKIEKTKLKNFLSEKLPDYMIPGFFVQLETIPLTPNGKVNKNRLPDISEEDVIKNSYVAPRNDTEEKLVHIWKELLEVETIGTKDVFFELGGHSLKITKLKNYITKTFEVDLSFNDLFLKTTISEQALLIEQQISRKEFQQIPKAPNRDYYPMSSSQQRIWLLSQFEGSSVAYNMSGVFDIKGIMDSDILQKVFEILIERHEVLRTRFIQRPSGELTQQILTSNENNFKIVRKQLNDSSKEHIRDIIKKEVKHVFDLENECLLRASLLQLKEEQFILTVVIHHIVSDGWSIDLLTNELFSLYNSCINGKEKPLPLLTIQYKDFAVWEHEQLNDSTNNKVKEYWLTKFSDEIPVLELPYKQKRPLHKTYEGKIKTIPIPEEIALKFKFFCKENNSTLFMGLLTLVKVLLYRYTNQKDIIIGSPIAGREHIQLQNQLGVYINTLALRTQFDGRQNFKEVLQKVKKITIEAYEHQSYPFDRLIEDLNLPRDLNRNPLFDIMVTLQNTDEEHKVLNYIDGIAINEIQISDEISCKFDLDFVFEEVDQQINLSLIYNISLFEDKFISDLCEQFAILLKNSLKTPEIPICDLQILTSKQKETLLESASPSKNRRLDSNKTFISFFKDWVLKTPNSVAVRDNKNQLTYDELDRKSDNIAIYINSIVSKKEMTIGVVLGRSVNTISILLGILKSGKAYIPLDPTFPMERLKYIVSHSGTKTLICDKEFSFFGTKDITLLTTENILSESNNNELSISIKKLPKAKDTAYIIYTSGSTGNPKGVEVGHHSLMNFLLSIKERPGIQTTDLLYAVTTYSFDISILEFFAPLISGASVFIANNEILLDAHKIIKDIESVQPSIIQATPSFFQLLFNAGWRGNKDIKILCGGDSLSEALASQLLLSNKELWNMYGPTETTIWSSVKNIKKPSDASNIGSAIDNTSLYVLGEYRELLPKGAQGILYVGGEGIAKGYYKDDFLTQKKFIENPFGKGLLYETGDIVKRNDDNELTFFGRNDNQVKVRGYRIELGDIETKLNGVKEITQAVVIIKKDSLNEAILIAFYKSSRALKISDLKKQLKKSLPDYMIPSQFIQVDEFPLTPNRKIDRKTLSNMSIQGENLRKEYIEPRSETEKELVSLWKDFFEVEKISIDDNFFDLGGHSLTATKLVSRIQEEFSIKLSINKIFEHATVEEQAELIESIQLINQMPKEEGLENEFENFTI